MRYIGRLISDFVKKADMVLLLLCTMTTIFGIVAISSATATISNGRHVTVQSFALLLGIIIYVILTLIDVDIIAERRELLLIFCIGFIGILMIWGVDNGSGNKSWLNVPFIGIDVQPAEICKIFFIIILAKIMSVNQNSLSSPLTVGKMGVLTVFFFVYIVYISSDAGVALTYIFIFISMAFVGGVSLIWFLLAFGALLVAVPVAWSITLPNGQDLIDSYQKDRIMMLFDPTIDPEGKGVRWQTNLSLRAIQNGGVSGQGLYEGTMVKGNSIPAQHTDFIFSAIAEEMGMLGCVIALLLLSAIVIRCIYVGVKSRNYMNRMICCGIAGMLLFQIVINVGMCLGVMPVIGLTLPFISYGGSSIVTMFLAMGVVSGIHMRPAPDGNARYIRPKQYLS